MKKRKKELLLISVVALLVASTVSYLQLSTKDKVEALVTASKSVKKTIYPTQYSDSYITKNAIVSDPRFRNVTFFDRASLLANVGGSVQTNIVESGTVSTENGTWLWTPILNITPEYRDFILSGATKNGVRNIYLSIDTYLDIFVMQPGAEKDKVRKDFDDIISDFIKEANEKGITVDAEAGWRNWAENGHEYKAFATLYYTIEFNKNHTEKFRGFQYDVEPYLLDSYDKDKKSILYNFVDLMNQTVSSLDKTDLELSVVIPDFYDGQNDKSPSFSYRGKSGFTFDHLVSVLDRRPGSKIILMSYRNFTDGEDGTIEISKNEIIKANNSKTKVVIAQETGNVEPPYITFFNKPHSYYNKQLAVIQKTFYVEKSYGGLATHYVNSLLELK
ncbi:MAG: hypothetical protein WAX85_02120 [Minisyncoccia bacterium]